MNEPVAPTATRRPIGKVLAVMALSLVVVMAVCELLEWPFLAGPLQSTLSSALDRKVSLTSAGDVPDPNGATDARRSFGVRFIGGMRLHTAHVEIAAPAWSKAPHFLTADNVALKLRYIDLIRASRGGELRIASLQASTLDGNFEREADGRASWQFGKKAGEEAAPPPEVNQAHKLPLFGLLEVEKGVLRYRDDPLAIQVVANISLDNGTTSARKMATGPIAQDNVLNVDAAGTWRGQPLKAVLKSSGVLPWTSDDAAAAPLPVTLKATAGSAILTFDGTAMDAMHLTGMKGKFTLNGASLADAGKPLGVTLPTTGAFRTSGVVVKQGDTWRVLIEDATVGSSKLNGAFAYEAGLPVPLLAGKLGGSKLLLSDLAPAIGAPVPANANANVPATKAGRVLPDRKFDLPSLRAMDANVLFDIAEVDLNTSLLEPLRPLHGRVQLNGGVLKVTELSARTAQGTITGGWSLDGGQSVARWDADLRWQDVQLDRWIHQTRKSNAPPYISGGMNGRAVVKGQGQSTADILGTLKGRVYAELQNAQMSHLIVELAGLDIAQGLGLLFKGDEAIAVTCGVTELQADQGIFKSRVTVIDTPDSTIWLDGTVSFANEGLDLRAIVTPKDFSPLSLRTPLLVRGSFADPKIAIEKGQLTKKLGGAALLSLLNPIAALLPLVDRGDKRAAAEKASGCEALALRGKEKLSDASRIK